MTIAGTALSRLTQAVTAHCDGAYFRLTADINLAKCDGGVRYWNAVGTVAHPFTGHFDGSGHSIMNMYQTIENGGVQVVGGLFGLTNNAEISNVQLVQCYVDGEAMYVGALVGYAGLTNIYNCSIYDGHVSTNRPQDIAGGLVGFAGYTYGEQGMSDQTYNITACQVSGAVMVEAVSNKGAIVGGVVGQVSDVAKRVPYVIDGCVRQGVVDGFYVRGGSCAGGIVGSMWYGTIVRCSNNQKVT